MTSFAAPGKPGGLHPPSVPSEANRTAPPATETPKWAVGWVYLLNTPIGYQKIGFSTLPERRLSENTKLPFDIWIEHSFPVGNRKVETRLHHFFAPRKARGEWFNLGGDGVELVKTIAEARHPFALPAAFGEPRYVAPYAPGLLTNSWNVIASGFALRLITLRSERGLMPELLAERSGVPPHVIRGYESSTCPHISWHEVVLLARGLGCPTDAFREGGKS